MAGSRFSVFSVALCILLLWHGYGCVAQIEQVTEQPQSREQQQRPQEMIKRGQECRIESLTSLEPSRRVESEAGVTEYWDETNQQLECAGVSVIRQTIMQRGLLLPTYSNAPRLAYILQGSGITGELISGCPETFQSFHQPQQGGRRAQGSVRDQHQKIRNFREGDILAIPGGVAHWCYNDGQTPVVVVAVFDTRNSANQLDSNLRSFRLAGNQPGSARGGSSYPAYGEESSRGNIFSGFDTQTLAEAFGVSQETARKIQNRDDRRGNIVHVDEGLQVVRPGRREYQEEEEEEEEEHRGRSNGLDEVLCNMKLIENIDDPTRADFYSPEAGRISSLNSFKLPILSQLRMSAERGVLYRDALLAPLWSTNAHSVVYVTKGPGRVQIVGNHGRPVFDGQLRQGQLVIVPQNFAVTKQAGSEGFEWVAFKTAENAMSSPIVGKASALRGMPEEVLMNAYRISRQEARSLKQNRDQEVMVFSPRSRSQGGRSAA